MLCSHCKKQDATFHFKGVVEGKSIKFDLCAACAQSSAVQFPGFGSSSLAGGQPFSFPSLPSTLTELFNLLSNWPKASPAKAKTCPYCRWTLSEFRRTGKLGCSECHNQFRPEIRDIIGRIQGTGLYKGKKPRSKPAAKQKPMEDSLESLQEQLERAIKEERFEDAASLRDRIYARQKQRP